MDFGIRGRVPKSLLGLGEGRKMVVDTVCLGSTGKRWDVGPQMWEGWSAREFCKSCERSFIRRGNGWRSNYVTSQEMVEGDGMFVETFSDMRSFSCALANLAMGTACPVVDTGACGQYFEVRAASRDKTPDRSRSVW